MTAIERIIIKSVLQETLTEDEALQLKAWIEESEMHRTIYQRLAEGQELAERIDLHERINVDQALRRVESKNRVGRIIWRQWMAYAAVFVVGVMATFFVLQVPEEVAEPEKVVVQEIQPGTRKAQLVLASGEKVNLNDSLVLDLKSGGAEIRIKGNVVEYEHPGTENKLEYNQLFIPQGGVYSLVLTDGTKVVFNAMTRMEYPVQFIGKERRVKLSGEAYFEVARDTVKPFIVELDDYSVTVLGTSFNVESYEGETHIRTTLCSGKVRVSSVKGSDVKNVDIKSGQQFVWNKANGQMTVKEVDTGIYTAWVNNDFCFSDNTLEEIFTVLQRWYDIQVFFAGKESRQQKFSGKFSRLKSMEVILKVMQEAGIVLTRKGNVITVG